VLSAARDALEMPSTPSEGEFAQRLVRQAWGGIDFHVRDVDGNVISFVQYRQPESLSRVI
jgi:hypothetical protein